MTSPNQNPNRDEKKKKILILAGASALLVVGIIVLIIVLISNASSSKSTTQASSSPAAAAGGGSPTQVAPVTPGSQQPDVGSGTKAVPKSSSAKDVPKRKDVLEPSPDTEANPKPTSTEAVPKPTSAKDVKTSKDFPVCVQETDRLRTYKKKAKPTAKEEQIAGLKLFKDEPVYAGKNVLDAYKKYENFLLAGPKGFEDLKNELEQSIGSEEKKLTELDYFIYNIGNRIPAIDLAHFSYYCKANELETTNIFGYLDFLKGFFGSLSPSTNSQKYFLIRREFGLEFQVKDGKEVSNMIHPLNIAEQLEISQKINQMVLLLNNSEYFKLQESQDEVEAEDEAEAEVEAEDEAEAEVEAEVEAEAEAADENKDKNKDTKKKIQAAQNSLKNLEGIIQTFRINFLSDLFKRNTIMKHLVNIVQAIPGFVIGDRAAGSVNFQDVVKVCIETLTGQYNQCLEKYKTNPDSVLAYFGLGSGPFSQYHLNLLKDKIEFACSNQFLELLSTSGGNTANLGTLKSDLLIAIDQTLKDAPTFSTASPPAGYSDYVSECSRLIPAIEERQQLFLTCFDPSALASLLSGILRSTDYNLKFGFYDEIRKSFGLPQFGYNLELTGEDRFLVREKIFAVCNDAFIKSVFEEEKQTNQFIQMRNELCDAIKFDFGVSITEQFLKLIAKLRNSDLADLENDMKSFHEYYQQKEYVCALIRYIQIVNFRLNVSDYLTVDLAELDRYFTSLQQDCKCLSKHLEPFRHSNKLMIELTVLLEEIYEKVKQKIIQERTKFLGQYKELLSKVSPAFKGLAESNYEFVDLVKNVLELASSSLYSSLDDLDAESYRTEFRIINQNPATPLSSTELTHIRDAINQVVVRVQHLIGEFKLNDELEYYYRAYNQVTQEIEARRTAEEELAGRPQAQRFDLQTSNGELSFIPLSFSNFRPDEQLQQQQFNRFGGHRLPPPPQSNQPQQQPAQPYYVYNGAASTNQQLQPQEFVQQQHQHSQLHQLPTISSTSIRLPSHQQPSSDDDDANQQPEARKTNDDDDDDDEEEDDDDDDDEEDDDDDDDANQQ